MTPGRTPGLEIASAIPTSADPRLRFFCFLPGLLAKKEMAPRSNRRSGNLLSVKVSKTENLNRTTAKRIPSRPGVVKHPNKAVYIRADLTCYSHFSLATRRRTIHTEKATCRQWMLARVACWNNEHSSGRISMRFASPGEYLLRNMNVNDQNLVYEG
jgi:hypothetical protein